MPQPLGSKERTLFSQVVKNYENKQYKKGLKAAEQILRKAPDHGDTQAMKALIINSQGNSDEAFALAKIALKNDMKSHVCWHVYGLLYRSVKNFEESIKAYKFALKLEPDSQQIQRDLALLQIQMRDYAGYVDSRRAMLQARSGLRSNWTALAIAQHLSGNLVDAEKTLTTYEETLKSSPPKTDTEHAEALLYKNTIIAETGDTQRALDHLDSISVGTFDRQTVMEMRAAYLLKLDRREEAEKVFRALLERNAEYRQYYDGLIAALALDKTDVSALRELYSGYAEKNPRGDAANRIPLDFLDGEDFRIAADRYLQRMLNKGVPSTFANIKSLYSKSAKRDIVQQLVESYAAKKYTPQPTGSTDKQINGDKPTLFETSTLYFLAQHYNYHLSRDLTKATKYIDQAIELSPDSVDFHMTKARTWKHYGNTRKASETMEKARSLDVRDRYINTKAAKYQLRNHENAAALVTMSKYTRNEAVGGPLGDLHDMQCIWFITEEGESYMRKGKLGLALKRFTSIYNIFEVWQEDQFDFHTFSLRKGQIRAYIDMIRWEDKLRKHPFFTRAAIDAIKVYILLFEKPHLGHGSLVNGTGSSNGKVDASEQKKAARKARKAQEKQEQVEAEKIDAKKTAGVAVDGEPKKLDKDPEGKLLAETADPLKDAMKFLTSLLEFSPKHADAQEIGFEVYLRRKKYLLALRCLLALHSLAPSSPATHYALLRFQHTISTLPTPLPAPMAKVITAELRPLLPSSKPDLSAWNEAFLDTNRASPQHVYAVLRVRKLLDPASVSQSQRYVIAWLEKEELKQEEAVTGLELLREWDDGKPGTMSDAYRRATHQRWPEATVFESVKASG